jgi:hypothetical protein
MSNHRKKQKPPLARRTVWGITRRGVIVPSLCTSTLREAEELLRDGNVPGECIERMEIRVIRRPKREQRP